jgi:hypothetical protein
MTAAHLRAQDGRKPAPSNLIVAETITEVGRKPQEIVGSLGLPNPR